MGRVDGQALWTIPSNRFKSDTTHRVPLSGMAMQLLDGLPRCGEYLFSMNGIKPVDNFSKNKKRLDKLMGDGGWVVHDLRRVVRSKLASFRCRTLLPRWCSGTARATCSSAPTISYQYEPEMRDALERWASKLRDMVTPPPPNVTEFPRQKSARARDASTARPRLPDLGARSGAAR